MQVEVLHLIVYQYLQIQFATIQGGNIGRALDVERLCTRCQRQQGDKVNTLDSDKYEKIQTKIISALDKGDYVTVTGRGNNHTDIKVNLVKKTDPEKQTVFENCLDDVNIPLGEVFTSPELKGTEGILHVTEVYLDNLKYKEYMPKLPCA